jgi:hypothetical protein
MSETDALVDPKVIVLRRWSRFVVVGPVPPAVLVALRSQALIGRRALDGTVSLVRDPIHLAEVEPCSGCLVLGFLASMEPAVRQTISGEGYRLRIIGEALPPLVGPALSQLGQFAVLDRSLLDVVSRHPQVLVRHGQQVDPAVFVAQLALAWPDLKIAVAVAEREQAWCLGHAIDGLLADENEVSTFIGPNNPGSGRIVVATYKSLAHSAYYRCRRFGTYDLSWVDLLIIADAVTATGKVALSRLRYADRARLVGFLAEDVPTSRLERDMLTALFGFQTITIPRHGHRERPVQLAHYTIEGGMELPASLNGVPLKRRGLWHNAVRNRKVTHLAEALISKDKDTVKDMLGETVAEAVSSTVLVLTENLEHARVLAQSLPGWRVFSGPHLAEEGLPPEQVGQLQELRSPFAVGPLHAIVTAAGLAEIDLSTIDVLIRADGGVGLPPLRMAQLAVPDQDGVRPLLVIDFVDRHHHQLCRHSHRRQDAYADRGWFAVGVDPVQGRIGRFLATRPGRKTP